MADAVGQLNELSIGQLAVLDELGLIFPSHSQTVLKQTVLTTASEVTSINDSLQRCIEVLVDISPSYADGKQSELRKRDSVLSTLQKEVLTHLAQIFPNFEMKVIQTAVCHPSNLFEPLAEPTLLQRCIDDILDGRTAIEAYSDWEDNAESLVEPGQDNPEEDISVTMVEESKDILITRTEQAKDVTVLEDDDDLPPAEQVVEVNSASFRPSAEHTINVTDEQKKNNQTSKISTPTVPQLKTELTTNTSHERLLETEDNVLDPEPKSTLALDSLTSTWRLSTSLFSTEISSMSARLNLLRDDVFSSKTFDFSSDSQSSASSVDTVPDDDNDLPTITFPNKIRSDFMTPPRFQPDVKLERAVTNETAHPPLPFGASSTNAQHSPSSFKLEPSKFTFSSSSKQPIADHSTRTSDIPQINARQTQYNINGPVCTTQLPCVTNGPNKISVHMQGIDPSAQTIAESCAVDAIPPLSTTATTWKPVTTAKCQTSTWTPPRTTHRTPPRTTPSTSTVTIKSTHNITYNTPVHESITEMRAAGNTREHGDARPKYSASVPNILVQQPMESEIEIMDTSSAPSLPNTEANLLQARDTNRHKLSQLTQLWKCTGCNADIYDDVIISHWENCPKYLAVLYRNTVDSLARPVKAGQRMNPNDAILTNRTKFDDGQVCSSHGGYENSRKVVNSRGKLQAKGGMLNISTIEEDTVMLAEGKFEEGMMYLVRDKNGNARTMLSSKGKLQAKPRKRYTHNLPGNATTKSKTSDLGNNQFQNPLTKGLLRPSVLSNTVTGNTVLASTAPGVVRGVMKTSVSGTGMKAPKLASNIWRTSGATHTVPNPSTVLDPTPFIISHDPVDVTIQQLAPASSLIAEDPVRLLPVIAADTECVVIPDDPTVTVKNDVLALFPNVHPDHLDMLAQQHIGPMAVNNICCMLLEDNGPKKMNISAAKTELVPEKQYIDYFKDYHSVVISDNVLVTYLHQAFYVLSQDFQWLAANDIKAIMKRVNNFYSPSYKALHTVWHKATDLKKAFRGLVYNVVIPASEAGGTEHKLILKLLRNRRPVTKLSSELVPDLQREVDFVKQWLKDTESEADHRVALAINEQEYEDQDQCIECGCCYGEYPFEQLVQCYEGHLFCENCLRRYAKESVFGQGKADLKCMTDLCDSAFPKSQLLKALPYEVLARYEDRVMEENLNLADHGDLVKCSHCDFRAFMDPGDKVFRCQMDACRKESCRYCHVEWDEHFGKKCSEVEKKDETKLRLEYEEKMTKAKVRVCHRCKAQFMKEDGCNKMTCRCGANMCYICRLPNITYNHFCRHPRDPGKECTSCKDCSLWTNPEEDDNCAIAEMQKEAKEERKKKGFTETKVIGVPDQPPKKKVRR